MIGKLLVAAAAASALAAMGLWMVLSRSGDASPEEPDRPATAGEPRAASRPADATEAAHPIDPALEIARDGLQHIRDNVRDYTATIVKRERVGDKLGDFETMFAKIRNRKVEGDTLQTPFAVYLKFMAPDSVKGREVIWVEGQNDGKLVAHEKGLLNIRRWHLDPNGLLATMGQRYSITNIGLEKLVEELIKKGETQRQYGECEVRQESGLQIAGRECSMIEVVHPHPRPHFDFHKAQIFIDEERNIPLRYVAWGWPLKKGGAPIVLEEYTYHDVKLNVGLTARDFDPDNPDYDYP